MTSGGRINARELHEQINSCSCLTLILACVIYWQAREISRAVRRCKSTDPQALEARHDLSCAAPAHTEELLDRRAVEVSGCHGTRGAKDFVKWMKPGGLGGHGGSSCSATC